MHPWDFNPNSGGNTDNSTAASSDEAADATQGASEDADMSNGALATTPTTALRSHRQTGLTYIFDACPRRPVLS
jgi:hypothetical protein